MGKKFNSSQLIYDYLNGESKANITVSKLPAKIQRQLITQSVQRITGGIQRNLNETQGGILDQSLYGEGSPHSIVDAPSEELHTLQINDISFEILPTQIAIQYQTHSFKSNTIRSQGPVKTKSGRGIISIQLQLVFVGLSEINSKLRRLIAQARVLPIWYIDNEVIRSHVYPEDTKRNKNIGVVVNNLTLTTHPEAVETLVATLSLEVFNWEVYSRSFNFVGSPDNLKSSSSASNFSNPTSMIGVKNPLDSDLFKGYWNKILGGSSDLELNVELLPEVFKKELQKYGELSSKMKLYKTQDSFSFPEITPSEYESSDIFEIEYSSYKIIPEEVIKTLLLKEVPSSSEKQNLKMELVNQKKYEREFGVFSSTELKALDAKKRKDGTLKGPTNSRAILVSYKDVLNYAMNTSGFKGKSYYNDPDNRDRTDVFDCSSLVYNVLKKFGINIGTYTGSQLNNIRLLTDPIITGTKEDLWYKGVLDPNKRSLEGSLVFCFKEIPRDPREAAELRKNNRIFTTSLGRDLRVGHVAFVSKDVLASETKNNTSKPYRKLTFYHAYSAGVNESSIGALNGYTYFEVYPIPNISYETDSTILPTKVSQRIKAVLETPAVKKKLETDFSGLYQGRTEIQKGEASILLYEASKAYGTKLIKALSIWLKKNKSWNLVWLRNGTFLLEKKNSLNLKDDIVFVGPSTESLKYNAMTSGPVLEHISVSISNTFARIPMNGHELVTHQYLGGGDCDVIVHIKALGLQVVQQIQMLRKYTEASARTFRYLDDVGTLKIRNSITKLCGSEKFIIESIESKTNPNSPELYDITIHFSEMRNNPRDSEAFKQEFTQTTEVRNALLEKLLKTKSNWTTQETISNVFSYFKNGTVKSDSRIPVNILFDQGLHTFLNYKFKQVELGRFEFSYFSGLVGGGPVSISGIKSNSYGFVGGMGFPLSRSLDTYASTLRDLENQFKSKEEFIRALMFGPAVDLIGYALPLFYLLGITEDDLKKWTKDSKHPLYSFDLFNLINPSYLTTDTMFKATPRSLGFEESFASTSLNEDQVNVAKIMIKQIKEVTKILFDDLLIKRLFILKIPYKSSNFFVSATDWYSDTWSSLQDITLSVVSGLISKVTGASDLQLIGLANDTTIADLHGSGLVSANLIFGRFFATTNQSSPENTDFFFDIHQTKSTGLLNLQILAKFALVALFSQFRALMYRLGDVAINQLKYSGNFEDLIKVKNAEDFVLYGLPAYQDIPIPYLDFNNKAYSSVKQMLANYDMSPIQYLNPDFFFFNEGDHNELNAKRIAENIENATRLMQANYLLSHQFGILPSDNPRQPKIGPAVIRGSSTPNLNHETGALGGKKPEAIKANNLPDSLQNYYFPQVMGRSLSKGLAGFDGKSGTPLGLSSEIAQSRQALSQDQIKNALLKNNPTEMKFNPINPALQTVSFGPYGGLESRLGVLIDRTPQSSLEYYTNSTFTRNSSPYRIRRAMPALKMYFIEDDTSGLGGSDPSSYIRSFDDFFSYRAIKEIKYISSRNFSASTLIIRLSNIYGNMDSLQFSDFSDASYDPVSKTSDSTIEKIGYEKLNTPSENPFSRFILKEGIRVQLKAGFENNPDRLPVRFNGQITQINQESGDEVVIVCQDFGTQLIADIKGPDKNSIRSKWIDTFDLLSYLITQPEMTYFGRWTLDINKSVGESRSTGGWEKFFRFLADPRDDNLFTPTREQMIHHFSDESGGLFSNVWWNIKRLLTPTEVSASISSNTNLESKISIKKIARIAGRELLLIQSPGLFVGDKSGKLVQKATVQPGVATTGVLSFEYKLADFAYRGLDYLIYRQTIWDVFKEMELRHPGWVGHPIPYGNRMTMFFGQPTQPYWYRPPNSIEAAEIYNYNKNVNKLIKQNQTLKEIDKQIGSQQGAFIANKVTDTIKEYAWTVFDWGSFALSLYFSGQTLGLGTGALQLAKITASKIVKGMAAGAFVYALTNQGNNNFSSALGAIAVGLSTAVGGGRAALLESAAAKTEKAVTSLRRFNILKNVTIGAGVVGAGADVVKGFLSNTNMLLSLDSAVKQAIASQALKTQLKGRLKSFRDYHIVTSKNNIISNKIKSSVNNLYNAVTIEYVEDTKTTFSGDKNVLTAGKTTKVVRASHRILDKDIRMGFFSQPNCRGSWMADRYAQGLLMRYMKDAYQGELLVLGDWDYKPYDRVLIQDDYLGMYGQIEIEQVVHTISPELGFMTEITPDMVVYGNQIVDMVYDNYMSAYLAWKNMSWTDTIEATLKNDPSKFFENLQLRRDETGKLSGRGAGGRNNPSGFTEVEARMLNSIPTLFALTLAGGGLGAVAGGSVGGATGVVGGGTLGASAAATPIAAAAASQRPQLIDTNAARSASSNISTYIQYKLFGSMALKFYEWSTSRQPLLFEPLFINGKPMLPTIDLDKVSMFQNIKDQFVPTIGNLAKGFQVLQEAGRMFVYGELSEKLKGLE